MHVLVKFPADIWILICGEYPIGARLDKTIAREEQKKINGDRSPTEPGYCTVLQTKLY